MKEPFGVVERKVFYLYDNFDWKDCIRFIVEGLVDPHISSPLVQIGLIITL